MMVTMMMIPMTMIPMTMIPMSMVNNDNGDFGNGANDNGDLGIVSGVPLAAVKAHSGSCTEALAHVAL